MKKIVTIRNPRLYYAYKEEYDDAVLGSMSSRTEFTGEITEKFEEAIAKKVGRKYAVSTLTCTTALYMSLRVIGILTDFKNTNLLSTSFVHVAPADQALAAGYNVFLNDIDDYQNMIFRNSFDKEFSVILCAGLHGYSIDYDRLESFRKENNIPYIINDAAQSYFATWKGVESCKFGDISCLSFDIRKVMTSPFGQGGVCLTDNKEIYDLLISVRKYAQDTIDKGNYLGGLNGFLPQQISAALLVSLNHVDEEIEVRDKYHRHYNEALAHLPLELPKILDDVNPSHQKYPILCRSKEERETLYKYMKERDIYLSKVLPGMSLRNLKGKYPYTEVVCEDTPRADSVCDRILSLPINPEVNEQEIETVISSLCSFYEGKLDAN